MDEKRYSYDNERIKANKHGIEKHKKFTLTMACLLFFFIGAPLGGIIRKGGLGTPIVISILFFVFYYIVDTFGGKMARESVWPVWCGVWLSSAVLGAIGVFLTYKAATDSALFKTEAYARVADKIKMWIMKTHKSKKEKQSSEN